MNEKTGAIILAAGRGTRLNSHTVNKVALPFNGKPIIEYAVEVMEPVADHVVVVVGAFAESVKDALKKHPATIYAVQDEQLGTGHATKIGFDALDSRLHRNNHERRLVLVGYGDHMMFYRIETVKKLIDLHKQTGAVVSFFTVMYDNPDSLAWGRITRDHDGNVTGIVEQKDATEEEHTIKEVNPGFYLYNADFLNENLPKIKKSPVSGEYYLTDLIERAVSQGHNVNGLVVPFDEVGIGINRAEELEASQKLHESRNKT